MIHPDCGNPACRRTVADGARICTHCTDSLAEQLRGVPGLLDDLHTTLARADRIRLQGPIGARYTFVPLPLKLSAPDAIWTLGNVLTTWARDLAHSRDLPVDLNAARAAIWATRSPRRHDPTQPTTGPITSVELAAWWLTEHINELRTHPDAVTAHDEITDALSNARSATDRPGTGLFIGPCDECGADLYGSPDATSTSCSLCGAIHHNLAARWDDQVASLRDQAATATQIARAIGSVCGVIIKRATISQWHHRGQIEAVAWVPREDDSPGPRFLVGDVLDRAARSKPSKAG